MTIPAESPNADAAGQRRRRVRDLLEAAAAWFQARLRSGAGEGARLYLSSRGLPPSEHARFRLGFAPASRTGLRDHLVSEGAHPAELIEAGLLVSPDDGSAPYDRFRDRIMFSVADERGRLVSFGGRALNPEARAKYLNGPETPVFSKSRTLYGLSEARRLLRPPGESALVVVEGYFDVIACQRAGIAAVAPMGTALTAQQMELLWRQHGEPTLAFDGDDAGRRAEARALDRALPLLKPGRSFRFVRLPGGKDPDDVFGEQGFEALRRQLAATRPFVTVLFEREQAIEPLDTPERRTGFKARLRKAATAIVDAELSQLYRSELLERWRQLEAGRRRPPATAPKPETHAAARQLQQGR